MKAMKARRIPRCPGPMAMGSSPGVAMKESFSISEPEVVRLFWGCVVRH
jgi:hypothetical protein